MSSPPQKSAREDTAPFLVQLFYRQGAFHRPEEFASQSLPAHISVYTWSDCTLEELGFELAAARPSSLPVPSIGTRLAFQLVFPDLRNTSAASNAQPRFGIKDLGSIVIGEGGPSVQLSDDIDTDGPVKGLKDKDKTLNDARFVVGDYISCAVIPPLSDGSVAPASSIRREPTMPSREGRGGFRGGFQGRENGNGRGGSRGGRGGWRDEFGGGFPRGEWRRGERLPGSPGAGPSSRGRGWRS
ncbi:Sin3 associated polypeptide p18-domain-containing protein [Dactylonectria macrodidyma]|uniref:Sin3 associated polypeptide p18-domain-containing protein n=1 Tax=Dactylonectria macrodidyma TaxID=307937 RepID=A0A9P9ENC7_9HYPO|nr:Sin3 associated polypeptide p18-domain-containing protein [Dactylonectria macrodidyma]